MSRMVEQRLLVDGRPRVATADVKDLIERYGRGMGPTDLAKAAGGRITVQSMNDYRHGTAKFLRMPADATIMGLSDALRMRDDVEVLLAFARSGGRLRISDSEPLMVRELRMQGGIEAFDHYPALVADTARALGTQAHILLDLRKA